MPLSELPPAVRVRDTFRISYCSIWFIHGCRCSWFGSYNRGTAVRCDVSPGIVLWRTVRPVGELVSLIFGLPLPLVRLDVEFRPLARRGSFGSSICSTPPIQSFGVLSRASKPSLRHLWVAADPDRFRLGLSRIVALDVTRHGRVVTSRTRSSGCVGRAILDYDPPPGRSSR